MPGPRVFIASYPAWVKCCCATPRQRPRLRPSCGALDVLHVRTGRLSIDTLTKAQRELRGRFALLGIVGDRPAPPDRGLGVLSDADARPDASDHQHPPQHRCVDGTHTTNCPGPSRSLPTGITN